MLTCLVYYHLGDEKDKVRYRLAADQLHKLKTAFDQRWSRIYFPHSN